MNKQILFRPLLLMALIFGAGSALQAQLVTIGGYTAADLVQNFLLGNGVQVSNITFQGSTGAMGFFDGTNTNIGLNQGVILTTGTISGPDGPQGPNNKPNAGVDNGTGGSALLSTALGGPPKPTFNATIITFDFIPSGDSINFRYVFGSEEYKEYVGSEFNDVFGFFITGPNPSGGFYTDRNLAIVPNSNTPVAINNVNHLTNTAYFVDNESPAGLTIQYDGFTKVMVAKASVVPCSTYTIKLAIADVSDGIYDSGVFLEAKSFSSEGADISYEIVSSIAPDSLYESCGKAIVTLTRSNTDASAPYEVNLSISGTATNGVDYNLLSNQVIIPAGQQTTTFDIIPNFDGIVEGDETIIIEIFDPHLCPGVDPPRIEIKLIDVLPLTVVAMPDTGFDCNNELVLLSAVAQGGVGNLTYSWSPDGGTGNPFPVITRTTTLYTVTVTDQCGNQTAMDDVLITVPNAAPLVVTFNRDTAICPGEPIILNAVASGGIGDLYLSWSNNAGNVNQSIVYPYTTTVFSVQVEDSCGNIDAKSALVTVLEPTADFSYMYRGNSKLQFTSMVSEDVVKWEWDFGDGFGSIEPHPLHQFADTGYFDVRLVVTNAFGCTDTVIKMIYAYPEFVFFIPNTFTPNGNGLNDVFSGKGVGFTSYKMLIFNRWGEEIFETDDYKRGWPGVDKQDKPAQLGVYVYRVEIATPPGEVHYFTGKINLIR